MSEHHHGVRWKTFSKASVTLGQTSDIDAAVDFINTVFGKAGSDKLDRALEVGKYLLDNLFDGDSQAFSSRSASSPSFSALCSDGRLADLSGGRKTLSNYVRVHILTERLPPETSTLGLSHRIKLLPAEPADQRRIAVRAAAGKWTARRVGQAVQDAARQRKGERTQESVTPAVQWTMNISHSTRRLKEEPLAEVPADDIQWIYRRLLEAAELLADSIENIEADWKARGESRSLHPDSEFIAVDPDKLDELIEEMTGVRLDEPESLPDELRRRLERLEGRLVAGLSAGSSATATWWSDFKTRIDGGAGPASKTSVAMAAEVVRPARRGDQKVQSLAEKYRPRRFDNVVGNRSAITKLASVLSPWPRRAILIHGPTGTGKTTLARIWARAYLCQGERPNGIEPCQSCRKCKESGLNRRQVWGRCIEEIGAATFGNPKHAAQVLDDHLHRQHDVLIVNEADRLLIHQQQFLDYLDEDQDHPLIFCTADIGKFDGQFLGRCIRIETEAISQADMVAHIQWVGTAEGTPLSGDEATKLLDGMSPTARSQVRDVMMELEPHVGRQQPKP